MKTVVTIALLWLLMPAISLAIEISEVCYQGRSHFMITTQTATYYFDKAGGGISRMIDRYGNDWVAFKSNPWNQVPESAASAFRGIPNLVYGGEDGGCGHPGFDKCESWRDGKNRIRTQSLNGKWEWLWTFHEKYALWSMIRTDTTRCYWFLYEGPAGGSFDPSNSFWGNSSDGIRYDRPNHMTGQRVTGIWNRVCFGRTDRPNRLFIQSEGPIHETSSFSLMGDSERGLDSGDGMVVFGFGRTADSKPLLQGNHQFTIGFTEQECGPRPKKSKRRPN